MSEDAEVSARVNIWAKDNHIYDWPREDRLAFIKRLDEIYKIQDTDRALAIRMLRQFERDVELKGQQYK